jgi:hypothetical protein
MKKFDLKRYLIEGRLLEEKRFNINEEDKEEFGFFFPPMKGGVSDKEKAMKLFKQNGYDFIDGGMYVVDFKGKGHSWKEVMDLLYDNMIFSSQTYTYR